MYSTAVDVWSIGCIFVEMVRNSVYLHQKLISQITFKNIFGCCLIRFSNLDIALESLIFQVVIKFLEKFCDDKFCELWMFHGFLSFDMIFMLILCLSVIFLVNKESFIPRWLWNWSTLQDVHVSFHCISIFGLNSFFIFFGLDVGKSYSIIFYESRLFALLIWMCLTSKNDRAQETGIEEGILDILLNNNL